MRSGRRVVITGLSAVTPLGTDLDSSWSAMLAGESGISPIRNFESSNFVPPYAGEVKEFSPNQFFAKRTVVRASGRQIHLAVAASRQCMDDAGLAVGDIAPERLGVVFGTGMLRIDLNENGKIAHAARGGNGCLDMIAFGKIGSAKLYPLWLLRHIPNLVSSHVAITLNAQGPSNTITTACTASALAIIEAAHIDDYRRGTCDDFTTGGAWVLAVIRVGKV